MSSTSLASFLEQLALPEVGRLEQGGATPAQILEELELFLQATLGGLVDTAEEAVGHRLPGRLYDNVRGGSRLN